MAVINLFQKYFEDWLWEIMFTYYSTWALWNVHVFGLSNGQQYLHLKWIYSVGRYPLCCIYPSGANILGSLIKLLDNFWILKYAKIQIFMYTIILATKDFWGFENAKISSRYIILSSSRVYLRLILMSGTTKVMLITCLIDIHHV